MSRRLQGRKALVTGAATGMGRATAELFARHGAEISYARAPAPDGSGREGNCFGVTFRTRAPLVPGRAPFATIRA